MKKNQQKIKKSRKKQGSSYPLAARILAIVFAVLIAVSAWLILIL
jgi:hypothetical protein